jgi:hypothetical protein
VTIKLAIAASVRDATARKLIEPTVRQYWVTFAVPEAEAPTAILHPNGSNALHPSVGHPQLSPHYLEDIWSISLSYL